MDPEADRDLLWIAEEGLIAELPGMEQFSYCVRLSKVNEDGWGEYTDDKGRPYYYNHVSYFFAITNVELHRFGCRDD